MRRRHRLRALDAGHARAIVEAESRLVEAVVDRIDLGENVTKARAAIKDAGGNPVERAENENMLSSTLKTLFAVAENYPDLKANANFLDLQREITDTENKIQASRRFYNTTIRDLNTKIKTFPTNLIAGVFKFKEKKFFEVDMAAEREAVKVEFDK